MRQPEAVDAYGASKAAFAQKRKKVKGAKRRRKGLPELTPKLRAVLATVRVPPVSIGVKIASTDHEGGTDSVSNGDVLIQAYDGGSKPTRWDLAQRLRDIATHVTGTKGDPIDGYVVYVLLRRPR